MQSLHILTFLLLFKSLRAGIVVGFGEDDISCSEDDGIINVLITFVGNMAEGEVVTLEVVPVTLEEYVAMNNSLPNGVDLAEDSAEPGLDFDSSSQFVTINDSMINPINLGIEITKDGISENDEVFLLFLRDVSKPAGGDKERISVTFGRAVTIARIEQPVGNKVSVSFNKGKIDVSEDSGTLDTIFIEISGQTEPTVSVTINSDSAAGDIIFPSHVTFSSNDSRHIPLPVHIIDDLITEDRECVFISLQQDFRYKSLYSIGEIDRLEICISDNDIPRLGFEIEPSGNETGDGMEIMEGETKRVCIVLVEPEDCDIYIKVYTSLSEDSPKDLIQFQPRPYHFHQGRQCFQVTASDNLEINHPAEVNLELTTEVYDPQRNKVVPGDGYVLTDPGVLIIKDNDGVPALPAQVILEVDGNSLHVSWQSQASDLRPVDKFIVVVQATPTRNINRSRRQAETIQVPLLAPEDSWEYETEETSLVVEFEDPSKPYTVSVCAANEFGKECSVPQEVTMGKKSRSQEASKELDQVELPSPEGLVGIEEGRKTSQDLVIAIAVVVPVMVLVLCMAVLCMMVICRSYGRSKEYYPARQGIIQEKIVLGSIDLIQPKYSKRCSSTSSVSMEYEWTSVELNNATPPASDKRPQTRILGTPV